MLGKIKESFKKPEETCQNTPKDYLMELKVNSQGKHFQTHNELVKLVNLLVWDVSNAEDNLDTFRKHGFSSHFQSSDVLLNDEETDVWYF